MVDSEVFRAQLVRGWAFMGLPEHEEEGIRRYLATGDRTHLPDSYRRLAAKLDQSAAQGSNLEPAD